MFGERLIDRVVTLVEYGAAAFLALVTTLTFVSMIMRYLFAAPIPDTYDFTTLMVGIAIFWGLACACWRGEHIQVDLFWGMLPRRAQMVVDVIATLVLLGFVAVLTWMVFVRVAETSRSGMTTADFNLPIWPFYAAAWLGLGLAVVVLAAYLYRLVVGRDQS
jgi:TRAP-type C4-dicarboxylate transport system permease small subunit